VLNASGTGTNLKVGRKHRSCAKRRKKLFLVVPLHFLASTISRFGERFRDGQYNLVSFLFAVLLLTVLPVFSHL